jgi:hypothetical protein
MMWRHGIVVPPYRITVPDQDHDVRRYASRGSGVEWTGCSATRQCGPSPADRAAAQGAGELRFLCVPSDSSAVQNASVDARCFLKDGAE